MNQTEQLIEVGRAYIDALNRLDREHPESVTHILDILDCVHPDPDYHLGVYIEKPSPDEAPTHKCDQAWFVCYKGDYSPIIRRPYRSKHGGVYNYGTMCYLRFTFDFFNHLYVEPTIMGAWQAYLLSIAKTLLPFSGGLYYTKRELIFSQDQLKEIEEQLEPSNLNNKSVDSYFSDTLKKSEDFRAFKTFVDILINHYKKYRHNTIIKNITNLYSMLSKGKKEKEKKYYEMDATKVFYPF
jgi:hypothetical protein